MQLVQAQHEAAHTQHPKFSVLYQVQLTLGLVFSPAVVELATGCSVKLRCCSLGVRSSCDAESDPRGPPTTVCHPIIRCAFTSRPAGDICVETRVHFKQQQPHHSASMQTNALSAVYLLCQSFHQEYRLHPNHPDQTPDSVKSICVIPKCESTGVQAGLGPC